MPKYLFKINYVGEGAKGLLKEGGSQRREVAIKAFGSLGGTMESMYYAFGDTDAFAIVELPEHASAVNASLLLKANGFTCSTTVLLTPEELDAASQKSAEYRPPGQ